MADLTSLLVRDQIVPVRRVEEAIQRQVISGGSIETVMLELALVEENVLASYTAAIKGMVPARREDVMSPSPIAVERLSAEVVAQYRIVPVSVRGQDLIVASVDKPSVEVHAQLEHAAGGHVIVQHALEVRVAIALAENYGLSITPRMAQLGVKLAARRAGDVRPVIATTLRPEAPADRKQHAIADDEPAAPAPPTAIGIPSPDPVRKSVPPREHEPVTSATLSGDERTQLMPPKPQGATTRARGVSRAALQAELQSAETRDAVLDALMKYAQQFFDYCVLFTVNEDVAEARDAAGDGAPTGSVKKIRHGLHDGFLARAQRSGAPCFGDLARTVDDVALAETLRRSAKNASACIPVLVRNRVVILLWGDRSSEPLEPSALSELLGSVTLVGDTFERLIRARKLKDWRLQQSNAPTRPGDLPAALLDASNPALTPTPAELDSPAGKLRALGGPGTVRTAPPPPAMRPQDSRTMPTAPLVRTVPPQSGRDSIPDLQAARIASHPPPMFSSQPPAPPRMSSPDLRREEDDTRSLPQEEVFAPQRISRVSSAGTQSSPGRVSSPDAHVAPRSVIVDMGSDVDALIARLLKGNRDDVDVVIEAMSEVGERALPVLTQNFPGPLWIDAASISSQRAPLARDVGPVPRALLAFRLRAASYIASLIEMDDAPTRKIAVLVAGDILHPTLVGPLGRRLLDVDMGIAQLAAHVLPRFARAPEYGALLDNLRDALKSKSVAAGVKVRTMWAMAELRDVGAIALLIDMLDSDDERLVLEAERSLITLTRQDLGRGRKRWDVWASKHLHQHRIEWLIDALLHPEEQMRTQASEELKKLSQEYFGYHPNSQRKERERVHKRYQEWWQSEGQKRFPK